MIDFTIVIPCYNAESTIIRCLESIACQQSDNYEIIVVDDCSRDESVKLIEDYIRRSSIKITLLINEKNLGPSLSRKKGIDIALGHYVCFCDSDDTYDSDFLQEMKNKSAEMTNDLIFCNHKKIFSDSNSLKSDYFRYLDSSTIKNYFVYAPDSLCCCAVSRIILQSIAFPDLRNGEDMALIPVIISKAKSIGYTDKSLYNYYCGKGTLSKRFSSELVTNLRNSFIYIENNIAIQYAPEIEFLGVRNYLYGSLINGCKNKISRKDYMEIIKWFENKYVKWWKNQYIKGLPIQKRIFLTTIRLRLFCFSKAIALIHKKIAK